MRKILIAMAMMLGSQLFAQEVPAVLDGVEFETVTLVTDSGLEFTAYIVESDYDKIIRHIRKNTKVVDREKRKDIKFVVRVDEEFEYLDTRAVGLKSVTIYKL